MSEFNSKFIKYLCLLLFLKGCAYFNTFYNAEEHFDTAERIRIENLGNQMPSRAIQEYGRAIEKSEKVKSDFIRLNPVASTFSFAILFNVF